MTSWFASISNVDHVRNFPVDHLDVREPRVQLKAKLEYLWWKLLLAD